MSPITIVGDRAARWAKQRHVVRRALSPSNHVERSPRNLYSAGYTTFTGPLRDRLLRPTALIQRYDVSSLEMARR
jgi:hypothetical protein